MAYITAETSELLTEEHLDSLHKANIWTINDLCSKDLMDIKRLTGIKFHVLKDVHDRIKQRYTLPCHDLNFVLEKCIQECKMCPTGLPELTAALDGGFQTQEIVEFSGDSETGKTELCYLLCGEILSHHEDYHILYIASDHDFSHEKVIKYTRSKAGNRELSEDDLFKALGRIDIARPTKLADLTHLLNTLVHGDRRNLVKCIIIDSLSFIIQDDILEIKIANLDDADELEKFLALKGLTLLHQEQGHGKNEFMRTEIIDIYLHEVMRLLTNIAYIKNVIVVLTNADEYLATRKSWTNAIDHRIQLSKIPDFSKIGMSIPFAINEEGLFAVRLASLPVEDSESSDD